MLTNADKRCFMTLPPTDDGQEKKKLFCGCRVSCIASSDAAARVTIEALWANADTCRSVMRVTDHFQKMHFPGGGFGGLSFLMFCFDRLCNQSGDRNASRHG